MITNINKVQNIGVNYFEEVNQIQISSGSNISDALEKYNQVPVAIQILNYSSSANTTYNIQACLSGSAYENVMDQSDTALTINVTSGIKTFTNWSEILPCRKLRIVGSNNEPTDINILVLSRTLQ